jgi:UDP-glucuronate 4-epimerase
MSARILLDRGDTVVGLDNLNAYYDPQLKLDRLARLRATPASASCRMDVEDRARIPALFAAEKFDRVVHLAAQAGVRLLAGRTRMPTSTATSSAS